MFLTYNAVLSHNVRVHNSHQSVNNHCLSFQKLVLGQASQSLAFASRAPLRGCVLN